MLSNTMINNYKLYNQCFQYSLLYLLYIISYKYSILVFKNIKVRNYYALSFSFNADIIMSTLNPRRRRHNRRDPDDARPSEGLGVDEGATRRPGSRGTRLRRTVLYRPRPRPLRSDRRRVRAEDLQTADPAEDPQQFRRLDHPACSCLALSSAI